MRNNPANTAAVNSVRLNKFLAERLGISRRQADELITAGQVKIERGEEQKVAKLGEHIDKNDKVWYNERIVPFEVNYSYLALNKPVGYVCSRHQQGEAQTIYELLPVKFRALKTVGRLDKDSSGIILLTNDGDFAFQMTHPKFAKTKIYEVELDRDLEPLHQQMISDFGIELEDGKSRLGLVRLEKDDATADRKNWQVSMSEGRNRQIRRTFAALGYKVKKLHRVVFGKYALGQLQAGDFEEIKP